MEKLQHLFFLSKNEANFFVHLTFIEKLSCAPVRPELEATTDDFARLAKKTEKKFYRPQSKRSILITEKVERSLAASSLPLRAAITFFACGK